MKNMIKSAMLLGLMFLLAGTTQKVMAQGEDVSLQSFYDELSPYGTWIQDPQYGYVWRPDVDQEEFRPYYTNGRWAMTEYGNTWVSDYDWGWAPFHYGRWIYNSYNQWVWIPDTTWGPAWVSWRSGGGYYGWAPLGPSINIGINIGRGGYRIPDMCWNFIPYNNIYYNSYPRYYGNRNRVYIQNTVIINNTYVRNNRTYYTGPRANDIYRNTNQRVTVYNVNKTYGSGRTRISNNTVNIYQPRPTRGDNNGNQAPRNVVQGNINRGPVRGGNNESYASNRNDRSDRGTRSENGYNRNGNSENRGDNNGPSRTSRNEGNSIGAPGRNGNSDNRNDNNGPSRSSRGDGNTVGNPNRDNENRNPGNSRQSVGERPTGRDYQPQRVDRSSPSREAQQPRLERTMEAPQRNERVMERQQSTPQRVERTMEAPQRTERVERQSQPRMERPQQQSQPRVERQESPRSSGGESRGGGGGRQGGNGRPGRG